MIMMVVVLMSRLVLIGGGGVDDGVDDIGVEDIVGCDDRKGYGDCPTYQELLTQYQDSTYWGPKDANLC